MSSIGIDVGSTFSKYCILDSDASTCLLEMEPSPIRQRRHFEKRVETLCASHPDSLITACGYGRKNIAGAHIVSELSALARGAHNRCAGYDTVLDIGGQDTKVIQHNDGRIARFFVNEKCAAGCGMFLSNVLHLLKVNFDDIRLDPKRMPARRLSSTCAVFAQTEIVSLIAEGVDEREIIEAVLYQILIQARSLIGKIRCDRLALSGGLGVIPGIEGYAEHVLDLPVKAAPDAPYLSAIGCALIGYEDERFAGKQHSTPSRH